MCLRANRGGPTNTPRGQNLAIFIVLVVNVFILAKLRTTYLIRNVWLSLLQAHQQLSFGGSSQVSFSLIFCPAFDFFADSERILDKYEILQYINLARVCLVIGHVFIMGKSIRTQYADI